MKASPTDPSAAPEITPPRLPAWAFPLLVVALLLAYLPALQGEFIWDDDDYVAGNPVLMQPGGLADIWFDVTATPQYYPLVHTSFWIEYRLWGLDTTGYHVVNVLLHALSALLLFRLLALLAVPGAWLGALLFAFHPVMAESVAWITERKNTLSLALYLAAFVAYWPLATGALDAQSARRRAARYALVFALFVGALFSKSVTSTWPAAVLVALWFTRGRITRADLARLAPFFVVALGYGALTVHLERTQVGAEGLEWDLTLVERVLIAGRVVWFYLGKLVWPSDLAFIYPRWPVSQAAVLQYAFPLAAAALAFSLWALRRRFGRGPLAAFLFFVGTLFPALGFFDVYPQRFSWVADHFQYHASLGLFAVAGAALYVAGRKLRPRALPVAAAALVLLLGTLTHLQSRQYRDLEALWTTTIERNPDAWLAHQNLGALYADHGHPARALQHYERALAIEPDLPETLYNYSTLISNVPGRKDEAIDCLKRALALRPDHFPAAHNLGFLLLEEGDTDGARAAFEQGLQDTEFDARLWMGIGMAHAADNSVFEAIEAFERARTIDPAFYGPWLEEAKLFEGRRAWPDAAARYEEAALRHPDPAQQEALRNRARDLRALTGG